MLVRAEPQMGMNLTGRVEVSTTLWRYETYNVLLHKVGIHYRPIVRLG